MDFESKCQHYRKLFPILKTNIYLNHASHSPWSTSSVKMMEDFIHSLCEGPMRPYDDWMAVMEKTRELLARFINADIDEVGFNISTSLSIALLTQCINWQPGDNIIVSDREFPSIVMPAKLLNQRGVEAKIVQTVDGLIDEDKLIGEINKRTRMMIVSLVNFLTGQRLDVRKISDACRNAGVFLVVDAIQGAGQIKIDVKELGCHSLCFGSPKWMFSPMGVGTIFIAKEYLNSLMIPQVGMFSVPDPWNFFNYDQPFVNACSRFECGCPSHIAHHGMLPALEMLLDLGAENIEKYLLDISGRLHDELTKRGARVVTPREDARRSAIVTFDAKSAGWQDGESLLEALAKANITVCLRMGLIRVSPHFYNNWDEIEKFLNVVFP